MGFKTILINVSYDHKYYEVFCNAMSKILKIEIKLHITPLIYYLDSNKDVKKFKKSDLTKTDRENKEYIIYKNTYFLYSIPFLQPLSKEKIIFSTKVIYKSNKLIESITKYSDLNSNYLNFNPTKIMKLIDRISKVFRSRKLEILSSIVSENNMEDYYTNKLISLVYRYFVDI